MKLAIIGTGNVGGTLGSKWAAAGHTILFGSLDPKNEKVQALVQSAGANASVVSPQEAASSAEIVVLAVPYHAAQETLFSLGNLHGKILVDCTNPLTQNNQLAVGFDTSGGEHVDLWAGDARVVKAFNSTGANNMANNDYGGQKLTMFICGNDPEAKKVVTQLSDQLGFETVDAGPLYMARFLEPLTMLWLNLAFVQGMGPNIGLKLLKR